MAASSSRASKIARIEEWVYLTAVYGYTDTQAQAELGHADKTVRGYKQYLAEHPEVRRSVLAVYGYEDEEIMA
jgi:hypothetical protein